MWWHLVVIATTILTRLGGAVVIAGGVAGWWGAFVSTRSDRRLRKFLDAQVREVNNVLDDDESAG